MALDFLGTIQTDWILWIILYEKSTRIRARVHTHREYSTVDFDQMIMFHLRDGCVMKFEFFCHFFSLAFGPIQKKWFTFKAVPKFIDHARLFEPCENVQLREKKNNSQIRRWNKHRQNDFLVCSKLSSSVQSSGVYLTYFRLLFYWRSFSCDALMHSLNVY